MSWFNRRKKARTVSKHKVPYQEMTLNQRMYSKDHDVHLRAVADSRGRGYVYFVTGDHSMSQIWKSKHTYDDAAMAVVAAESHIKKVLTGLLAATLEEKVEFTSLKSDD